MNARELRIGNWVMYSSLMKVNGNKISECEEHPSRFGAIALNERLLLQFGFKKVVYANDIQGYGTEYHLKLNRDIFLNYADDFSLGIYADETRMKDCLQIIPEWESVKYVHQLQNLIFALTGKEYEEMFLL
jgi:hypothetical protein